MGGPRRAAVRGRPPAERPPPPVSDPIRLLIADHGGSGLREELRPLEALGLELVPSLEVETTLGLLERGAAELLVMENTRLDDLGRGHLSHLLARPRPIPLLLLAEDEDAISAIIAGRTLRGVPWDLVRKGAPVEEVLLAPQKRHRRARHLAGGQRHERVGRRPARGQRIGPRVPGQLQQFLLLRRTRVLFLRRM